VLAGLLVYIALQTWKGKLFYFGQKKLKTEIRQSVGADQARNPRQTTLIVVSGCCRLCLSLLWGWIRSLFSFFFFFFLGSFPRLISEELP